MYRFPTILIQDIHFLREVLDPIVKGALQQTEDKQLRWHGRLLTCDEVVKWVICEELQHSHNLFAVDHFKPFGVFDIVYKKVNDNIPLGLGNILQRDLLAPQLYGDECQVGVSLKSDDLFLGYYNPQSHHLQPHEYKQIEELPWSLSQLRKP